MNFETLIKNEVTKICKKCGRILPKEKFRLVKGQFYNSYYLSQCKECEYNYQKEYKEKKNRITFVDDLEILIQRKYKEIKTERILDISKTDLVPIGTDERFVKLMDYRNTQLSNYGRVIRYSNGKYNLLKGNCDNYGTLYYSLRKNVFFDGKWIYRTVRFYAEKAVVKEFIVNPDIANNIYIWHSGYDKEDNYYRNLYPLNQKQYRIVKNHYMKTSEDSEEFIIKVMNDIRFKPDDWSRRAMKPTVCGIGYHGSENVDCTSESYRRWSDMINRCYNTKFHKRQPQYESCTVCEEWLNYSNFKVWYEEHKYGRDSLDLDKDILWKGNKVYSHETVAFVPHIINTLFITGKSRRGNLPLGVHYDRNKGKYRAEMSFKGEQKKLGTFDTMEKAFVKYKEYKEDIIRMMAEKHKDKIPYKVYEAMMEWQIEIDD